MDSNQCLKTLNIINTNAALCIINDYYFTAATPMLEFNIEQDLVQLFIEYSVLKGNDDLVKNVVQYIREKNYSEHECMRLRNEKEKILLDYKTIIDDKEMLAEKSEELSKLNDKILVEKQALESQLRETGAMYGILMEEKNRLMEEKNQLMEEKNQLEAESVFQTIKRKWKKR
jgi:uncharacterized protein (DUF3084 family)